MRKITYGTGVLLVLALTFSVGMKVGSQPRVATTDGFAKKVATQSKAAESPFEMMVRYGKSLPELQVHDLF